MWIIRVFCILCVVFVGCEGRLSGQEQVPDPEPDKSTEEGRDLLDADRQDLDDLRGDVEELKEGMRKLDVTSDQPDSELHSRIRTLKAENRRLHQDNEDLKIELAEQALPAISLLTVENRFICDTTARFLVKSDNYGMVAAHLFNDKDIRIDSWEPDYARHFGREHVIEFLNELSPGSAYKVKLEVPGATEQERANLRIVRERCRRSINRGNGNGT